MTSVGCRSGVHWMRAFVAPSIEPPIARASTVFAVPGTSSKSTCPPQMSADEHELDLVRLAVDDRLDVRDEARGERGGAFEVFAVAYGRHRD